MTIPAERLRKLLAYDPDTGIFTWKVRKGGGAMVGSVAGWVEDRYIMIKIDGKLHRAHQLAWLYVTGTWPVRDLDHADEDKLNNRIANLRLATKTQNGQNQFKPRSDNKSGYRGVSYYRSRNKWVAKIHVDGVSLFLGYFDTPEQASEAYLAAKKKYHPFWVDNRAERE